MRVLVVGGTRFIGRALLTELVAHGHEPLVVHRGVHEAGGLPDLPHLHAHRRDLASHRAELEAFGAEAVADLCANTGADTEAFLAALPGDPRLVMTSSMDVYRAFASLHAGTVTDPLPLDETAPVRTERLNEQLDPDEDYGFDTREYEKLDAERAYLARNGTVLRLPLVYGEHDYQRREEYILRRVRAGRSAIPIGSGTFLWTKGWVGDLAAGIRLALESDRAAGEVFNLGERQAASIGLWSRWILEAAGSGAELVRVPDDALPPDLFLTGAIPQHLLAESGKARAVLGYRETDPREALRRSVTWHLEHPPEAVGDLTADDRALAAVS